jgi:hypothetical protein
MTEKIRIDLGSADDNNYNCLHWLWFASSPAQDAIREKHRQKHLADQKQRMKDLKLGAGQ